MTVKLFQRMNRSCRRRCSIKNVLLKILQNSQDNICVGVPFLKKLNFINEETPTQVFSCEFWEIFMNSFFYRTPPVLRNTSGRLFLNNTDVWCNFIKKRLQHRCFPVNIAKLLRTAFFIEHLPWQFLQR